MLRKTENLAKYRKANKGNINKTFDNPKELSEKQKKNVQVLQKKV